MNKESFKLFMAWLDSASNEDLQTKKAMIIETLELFDDLDVICDAKRMIRFIDEEILCRLEIDQVIQRRA